MIFVYAIAVAVKPLQLQIQRTTSCYAGQHWYSRTQSKLGYALQPNVTQGLARVE